MTIDLWQAVLNGFATGLGVGISNWLIIKRLERLEHRVKNGKNNEPKITTEQNNELIDYI